MMLVRGVSKKPAQSSSFTWKSLITWYISSGMEERTDAFCFTSWWRSEKCRFVVITKKMKVSIIYMEQLFHDLLSKDGLSFIIIYPFSGEISCFVAFCLGFHLLHGESGSGKTHFLRKYLYSNYKQNQIHWVDCKTIFKTCLYANFLWCYSYYYLNN